MAEAVAEHAVEPARHDQAPAETPGTITGGFGASPTAAPLGGPLAALDMIRLQRAAGNNAVVRRVSGDRQVRASQRAPANGPAAPPPAGHRVVPDHIRQEMTIQVNSATAEFRGRLLPLRSRQVAMVLDNVSKYADEGKEAHKAGTISAPAMYVDAYIALCLSKGYDRGVVITDYADLWDDALEHASDDQLADLRVWLADVGSQYYAYKPSVDPDAASFLKQVGDPVFFRALQLMSFGIVDKELFAEADRAVMKEDYAGLTSFIGLRVGKAIIDTFTLGAGSAYLEGCYRKASEHPNATYDEVAVAGLHEAWNAATPTKEFFTIYNAIRGRPDEDLKRIPTKWDAMEKFFEGALKLIALTSAAKEARAKARRTGAKSPTSAQLHEQLTKRGGAKEEATAREGAQMKAPLTGEAATARVKEIISKGGWKRAVEQVHREGGDVDALEQARDHLQKELGGERTGQLGAGSDMDVTVKSYAEARQWMGRAARRLFGIDFEALNASDQAKVARRVHDALDVNVATDVGRVTFFDAPELSARTGARVENVGMRAAQMFHLRILKGLAERGNPEALRRLTTAAREAGVDPTTVKPLERVPEHEMTPELLSHLNALKAEVDSLAKVDRGRLTEAQARRLVELQTELLAYDPEAYFYGGAVKGEVGMRNPKASSIPVKPELTPNQALGNIRNNGLNALTQLSEGVPRGADPHVHAGGSPSFAKYIWRVLRTAQALGEPVDGALLAQAKRLYSGKGEAVTRELPDATSRADFARKALTEAERVEAAVTKRLQGADLSKLATASAPLAALDKERDVIGPLVTPASRPAAPPAASTRPAGPQGGEKPRQAGSVAASGAATADERTRNFERHVLPDLYLRSRAQIKVRILQQMRADGSRTLDVNREGASTPATQWWDCFLNGDRDPVDDPQAGISISQKADTVDREGAETEIGMFLSVQPPCPYFADLYRSAFARYNERSNRAPRPTPQIQRAPLSPSTQRLALQHGGPAGIQRAPETAGEPFDPKARAQQIRRAISRFDMGHAHVMTVEIEDVAAQLANMTHEQGLAVEREFKSLTEWDLGWLINGDLEIDGDPVKNDIGPANRKRLLVLLGGTVADSHIDPAAAQQQGEAFGRLVGTFVGNPDDLAASAGASAAVYARDTKASDEAAALQRRMTAQAIQIKYWLDRDEPDRILATLRRLASKDGDAERNALAEAYAKQFGQQLYLVLTSKLEGRNRDKVAALWLDDTVAADQIELAARAEKLDEAQKRAELTKPVAGIVTFAKDNQDKYRQARDAVEVSMRQLSEQKATDSEGKATGTSQLEAVLGTGDQAKALAGKLGVGKDAVITALATKGNLPELIAARLARSDKEGTLKAGDVEAAMRELRAAAERDAAEQARAGRSASNDTAPPDPQAVIDAYFARFHSRFAMENPARPMVMMLTGVGDKQEGERNAQLIIKQGRLPDWQELYLAATSDPIDMDRVRRVLDGKTPSQIKTISAEYKASTPGNRDLSTDLLGSAEQQRVLKDPTPRDLAAGRVPKHLGEARESYDEKLRLLRGAYEEAPPSEGIAAQETLVGELAEDQDRATRPIGSGESPGGVPVDRGVLQSMATDAASKADIERMRREASWVFGQIADIEVAVIYNRGTFAIVRDKIGNLDHTFVERTLDEANDALHTIDKALTNDPPDLRLARREIDGLYLTESRMKNNIEAYKKSTEEAFAAFVDIAVLVVSTVATMGASGAVMGAVRATAATIATKLTLKGGYDSADEFWADIRSGVFAAGAGKLAERLVPRLAQAYSKLAADRGWDKALIGAISDKISPAVKWEVNNLIAGGGAGAAESLYEGDSEALVHSVGVKSTAMALGQHYATKAVHATSGGPRAQEGVQPRGEVTRETARPEVDETEQQTAEPKLKSAAANAAAAGNIAEPVKLPPADEHKTAQPKATERSSGPVAGGGIGGGGGGKPPINPESMGIPSKSARFLQMVSDHMKVIIKARPANVASIERTVAPQGQREWVAEALPKMDIVKAKTITDVDELIGAPKDSRGLVGLFEPHDPDPSLAPELQAAAKARQADRQVEWDTRHETYGKYIEGGVLQIDGGLIKAVDPRVAGTAPEHGAFKPVAGDIDLFDVTHFDGSKLSGDEIEALTKYLRSMGIGIEHGAHLWWPSQDPAGYAKEMDKPEQDNKFAKIVAQHTSSAGDKGEKLATFVPREELRKSWADEASTPAVGGRKTTVGVEQNRVFPEADAETKRKVAEVEESTEVRQLRGYPPAEPGRDPLMARTSTTDSTGSSAKPGDSSGATSAKPDAPGSADKPVSGPPTMAGSEEEGDFDAAAPKRRRRRPAGMKPAVTANKEEAEAAYRANPASVYRSKNDSLHRQYWELDAEGSEGPPPIYKSGNTFIIAPDVEGPGLPPPHPEPIPADEGAELENVRALSEHLDARVRARSSIPAPAAAESTTNPAPPGTQSTGAEAAPAVGRPDQTWQSPPGVLGDTDRPPPTDLTAEQLGIVPGSKQDTAIGRANRAEQLRRAAANVVDQVSVQGGQLPGGGRSPGTTADPRARARAADYASVYSGWAALGPEGRRDRIVKIVNAQLAREGIPPVRVVFGSKEPGSAEFAADMWTMALSRRSIDADHISIEDFATLADNAVHETQHTVTTFRGVRVALSDGQLNRGVYIPDPVVREAEAANSRRDIKLELDEHAIGEAREIYELSVEPVRAQGRNVPAGGINRDAIIGTRKETRDAYDAAKALHAFNEEELKKNPTDPELQRNEAESRAAMQQAWGPMTAAHNAYIALPEETFSWRQGSAVGTAVREQLTLEADLANARRRASEADAERLRRLKAGDIKGATDAMRTTREAKELAAQIEARVADLTRSDAGPTGARSEREQPLTELEVQHAPRAPRRDADAQKPPTGGPKPAESAPTDVEQPLAHAGPSSQSPATTGAPGKATSTVPNPTATAVEPAASEATVLPKAASTIAPPVPAKPERGELQANIAETEQGVGAKLGLVRQQQAVQGDPNQTSARGADVILGGGNIVGAGAHGSSTTTTGQTAVTTTNAATIVVAPDGSLVTNFTRGKDTATSGPDGKPLNQSSQTNVSATLGPQGAGATVGQQFAGPGGTTAHVNAGATFNEHGGTVHAGGGLTGKSGSGVNANVTLGTQSDSDIVEVDGKFVVTYNTAHTEGFGVGGELKSSPKGAGAGASFGANQSQTKAISRTFNTRKEAEDFKKQAATTVLMGGAAVPTTAKEALLLEEHEKRSAGDIQGTNWGVSASYEGMGVGYSESESSGHELGVERVSQELFNVTTVLSGEKVKALTLTGGPLSETKDVTVTSRYSVTVQFDLTKDTGRMGYDLFCATGVPPVQWATHRPRVVELAAKAEHDKIELLGMANTWSGTTWEQTTTDETGVEKEFGGEKSHDAKGGWIARNIFGEDELHSSARVVSRLKNGKEAGYTAIVSVSGESGDYNRKQLGEIFSGVHTDKDVKASGEWTLSADIAKEVVHDIETNSTRFKSAKTAEEKMKVLSEIIKENGAGAAGAMVRGGGNKLAWDLQLKGDPNFPGPAGREQLVAQREALSKKLKTQPQAADSVVNEVLEILEKLRQRRKAVANEDKYTDLPEELRQQQVALIDKHIEEFNVLRSNALMSAGQINPGDSIDAVRARMKKPGSYDDLRPDLRELAKLQDGVRDKDAKINDLRAKIEIARQALAKARRTTKEGINSRELNEHWGAYAGHIHEADAAHKQQAELGKTTLDLRAQAFKTNDPQVRVDTWRTLDQTIDARISIMDGGLRSLKQAGEDLIPITKDSSRLDKRYDEFWADIELEADQEAAIDEAANRPTPMALSK
jgi:hypothetical protein